MIVRLNRVAIERIERFGEVDRDIEPDDVLDAIHREHGLLDFECLGNRDVPHHDIGVGHRCFEFFGHDAHGCGGLRVVRQVVDHIVIRAHKRDEAGADGHNG